MRKPFGTTQNPPFIATNQTTVYFYKPIKIFNSHKSKLLALLSIITGNTVKAEKTGCVMSDLHIIIFHVLILNDHLFMCV